VPPTTGRIDVIGVPFDSAGTNGGVARAPTALRQAGLVGALTRVGLVVRDSGDLDLPEPKSEREVDSHVIAPSAVLAMIDHVRGAVAESLDRQWIGIERDPEYARASHARFAPAA